MTLSKIFKRKETFFEGIINPDSEMRKQMIQDWKEYIENKEKNNG